MEEIEVDVTKGRLKTKGRGHRSRQDGNDSEIGRGGVFESIDASAKGAPALTAPARAPAGPRRPRS